MIDRSFKALALTFAALLATAAASPGSERTTPRAPRAEASATHPLHEVALPKGATVHIEKLCFPTSALYEHRQDEAMLQEWNAGWRLDHVSGLPAEVRAVPGASGKQEEPLTCFLAVFVPRTV